MSGGALFRARLAGGPAAASSRHGPSGGTWGAARRAVVARLALGLVVSWAVGPGPVEARAEPSQEEEASAVGSDAEALYFTDVPSVYSASKFEQPILEAPSAVTIVTAEEIRRFGYRTLAEILASVPGFYLSYDRNYTYVGVRGFLRPGDYNTRVLLLLDGHRLNESLYGTVPLGTDFPVDVDLIARVEVVRGPASALYGTHAFLGVINVITKRGRDYEGVEGAGAYGGRDTAKARVTAGGRVSGTGEALASLSYYRSGGRRSLSFRELATPPDTTVTVRNADEDQSLQAFAKLGGADLEVVVGHGARQKEIPTAAYETVVDAGLFRTDDQFDFFDVLYRPTLAQPYSLSLRGAFDAYRYNGDYPYAADPAAEDPSALVMNRDLADSQRVRTEAIFAWSLAGRNQLFLGGDLRFEYRQFLRNFDEEPRVVYTDVVHDELDWGVLVQDELRIAPELLLNVGVRFDQEDSAGERWSPRGAVVYEPLAGTSLKLLYGEAFRAPNFWEISYRFTGMTQPTRRVRPEVLRSLELVVEQSLGATIKGSLSGYRYRIDDLINLGPSGELGDASIGNAGNVETTGLELALAWRPTAEWQIGASYGFQDAEVSEPAPAELVKVPHHLAKLGVSVPLLDGAVVSGSELQYVGERSSLAGRTSADYVLVNQTFSSTTLVRGLSTSVSVYNLFDQRYSDPASLDHTQQFIQQDGRTVWFRLGYGVDW